MEISHLEGVIAGMPLPILAVDARQYIVAANRAAQDLFGPTIVDTHFLRVIRQPAVVDALENCLTRKNDASVEYADRHTLRETLYGVTITATDRFALLCFQDITPISDVEKMRRDFVANVSHELRTPLTSLIGFIETLRGPARGDPAAQERFLTIMNDEAGRMDRLIDDLLSLTRVEETARVRPTEVIDVSDVLMQVVRTHEPIAAERDVRFDLQLLAPRLVVRGDADQLTQVFSNLIINAVKYGDTGSKVEIIADERAQDPQLRAAAVVVKITDQGPGIAPEHIARLTERFYRVDGHRGRDIGGTGLGLAIVKHIVNRHRGRLKIESSVGTGSTFSVILPTA